MAKSLKSNGLEEIRALKKRALRQRALERIGFGDADYIVKRAEEIEARIVEMVEDEEETWQPE